MKREKCIREELLQISRQCSSLSISEIIEEIKRQLRNSKQLCQNMYQKYWQKVSIEVIVNLCLLLNGVRKMIQYDKFVYDNEQWSTINRMLDDPLVNSELTKVLDEKGNIVVYKNSNQIDQIIRDEGTYSDQFGEYLDPFYKCNFQDAYKKENTCRVSIMVINPQNGTVGPLLMQMCTPEDLRINLISIYDRFREYQAFVWKINKGLQLDLQIYTKRGKWKSSDSFMISKIRKV